LRNRRLLASHQRINADSSPFAHLQNQQPSDTPLPDRFPFDDDFNDDFDNYNNNDNNNVQPSANGRPPSRLAVVYPMISNAATPLNSRANRSIDTAIAQPSPNTERPFTRSMKRSLMKATSVAKQALMQATSPPKQRTSQEQRSVVRSNEQLFGHSGPRRNQPNVDDENDVFSDDSNNNNSHYNGNRLIGWVARLATRFGFEWDFLVVALIATGRLSMVPLRLVLSALFRIWFWFSFRLPKRIQSLIVVCLVCSIFGSLLYWRWNRSPLLLEIPNDFNGFITADEGNF
jgi:hypothetical protein